MRRIVFGLSSRGSSQMILHSKIQEKESIQFPTFRKALLYMHRFNIDNPNLPEGYEDFKPVFLNILKESGLTTGSAHVTIDSRLILKGQSHRLPGPHVDGNYDGNWGGGGGNGWLLGDKGRPMSVEDHTKYYCSNDGGMLIASNYSACKVWTGSFDFKPGQGGNCLANANEINAMPNFILKPNTTYLTNSTCIHESIPVKETVERILMRITLPPVKVLV